MVPTVSGQVGALATAVVAVEYSGVIGCAMAEHTAESTVMVPVTSHKLAIHTTARVCSRGKLVIINK